MMQPKGYIRARKKTYEKLISIALVSYSDGNYLSITELADKAGISRATAYRYFPTHSSLIAAIVENSLGPIFDWKPTTSTNVEDKIQEFLEFALPQMLKHEGALRSALQLSLQQWAHELSTSSSSKEKLVRGNRKDILSALLAPIKDELPQDVYHKLLYSLSVIYGSEMFIVLKDIWHLDDKQVVDVAKWMAKAVVQQAMSEKEQ